MKCTYLHCGTLEDFTYEQLLFVPACKKFSEMGIFIAAQPAATTNVGRIGY